MLPEDYETGQDVSQEDLSAFQRATDMAREMMTPIINRNARRTPARGTETGNDGVEESKDDNLGKEGHEDEIAEEEDIDVEYENATMTHITDKLLDIGIMGES